MMKHEITYSASFKKHFKDFTETETEKQQIKNKAEMLAQNPYHPSLRTKRIQGTDNLFECSVNMDIRIIWHYENDWLIPVDYAC